LRSEPRSKCAAGQAGAPDKLSSIQSRKIKFMYSGLFAMILRKVNGYLVIFAGLKQALTGSDYYNN
jgi:hypothetical protein